MPQPRLRRCSPPFLLLLASATLPTRASQLGAAPNDEDWEIAQHTAAQATRHIFAVTNEIACGMCGFVAEDLWARPPQLQLDLIRVPYGLYGVNYWPNTP